MDALTLPPDLERFAQEAIAQGRFRDLAEVIQAGVTLLRRAESERAAFVASLEEAEKESEREGFLTIEEVHQEMLQIIDEKVRART